jgi:hypothetical protein
MPQAFDYKIDDLFLVAEILSPATQVYDLRTKFSIRSLHHLLF